MSHQELKNDWKETGKGLGHAFKNLGKTVIKTAEVGVDKAVEWADRKDAPAAEAEVVSEKKVCEKCGTENPENANFCSKCGEKI